MILSTIRPVQRGTRASLLFQVKVPVQDEVFCREEIKKVLVDLRRIKERF